MPIVRHNNDIFSHSGHTGRVNCLLYPNNSNPRYDMAHLVSGGIDFSVCLWDIYTGTLLHRFSCHGGEVGVLGVLACFEYILLHAGFEVVCSTTRSVH